MNLRRFAAQLFSATLLAASFVSCGSADQAPAASDAGSDPELDAGAASTDGGALADAGGPSEDGGEADAGGGESDAGVQADAGTTVNDTWTDVCRDSVVASPKGTWLAYKTCPTGANEATWVQSVATGARAKVADHGGDELLFSPDETRLYVRGFQELHVVNTTGTPVLTKFPLGASWLVLTADGSKVIGSAGRKTVWVQAADGSGAPTTLAQWSASDPLLSLEKGLLTPDQTRVIFWGGANSYSERYIVPIDGSAPAAQIGTKRLELYPETLSDTHVLAGVHGGSLEDIELATGAGRVLESTYPQFPKGRGDAIFYAKNYRDIYVWRRGESAPVLLAGEGGQRFYPNPDGTRVFWFRSTTIASRPSDGSSAAIDVFEHGGVIGDFFGFGADPKQLALVYANAGDHGVRLGDLATAGSGAELDPSGVAKVGDTVGFNSTGTHVLYFVRQPGSDINILRSAPVASRTPETVASAVWRWHRIPGSSKVFFYTDVSGITDVVSTLHVTEP